jgi:glycosyltransferase involved in cell wall biosynthesis
MPKLSICIPTYNRASLLRATLRSVMLQTFVDYEVIVSDDASKEDIERVILEVNDPRIRFYQHRTNKGQVANSRFLQTVAKGEYVLFLDSDDLLLPECLQKAVHALDENPTRGGVVYMCVNYGENGFQSLSSMPAIKYADAQIYRENSEVRDFRSTSPSVCMYRRNTFDRIGGWDPELLAVHDWELYSRMIRQGGGMLYLREVLAIMRLHDNRVSNTSAMHWDFYHDVLIISSRPELRGGAFVEANAVMDQLLWDLRLKRKPWKTLRHAWKHGAWKSFAMLLPYEVLRRIIIKIGLIVKWRKPAISSAPTTPLARPFDQEATDVFWHNMTKEI